MKVNNDKDGLVYKSFRAKGQPFAAPFTALQCLDHGTSIQPLRVSACSFCLHDDSCLVTQTILINNTTRPFQAGFVQIWDLLSEDNDDDSLFTYSPVSEFSVSLDGNIIASILNSGQGMLYLVERINDNYPRLEPCKFDCFSISKRIENMNGRPCCCVFSPDGCTAVIVSVVQTALGQVHELSLWRVSLAKTLHKISKVICENILNGFAGRLHNCTFSLDGSLLALTTTHGQLYVLKTSSLEIHSVVQSTVLENNICMCAFHLNTNLVVCMSDGLFTLWSLYPRQPHCSLDKKLIVNGPCRITTMRLNQDYSLIAFGTTDGQVIIHDAESFHHLYTIDSKSDDADTQLEVCSLAFAKSCQEIAVGYNDGCVRIWQLPIKMNLQHLCRMEILQCVPEKIISKLPLPESLKAYLLFKATF